MTPATLLAILIMISTALAWTCAAFITLWAQRDGWHVALAGAFLFAACGAVAVGWAAWGVMVAR
jgi:hypothetical protein